MDNPMVKDYNSVYQFKITLKGIRPQIWRRIQVPETYTFWDLHVAIQDAMGWFDGHLHEFEILNPATQRKNLIGIPNEEFGWGEETLPGWERKIADYFSKENISADYTYDFGDGWEHKIILEKIIPPDKNTEYPKCLKGKRACPPEDCGGIWGYEEICRGESEFPEEYAGYDPEYFDVEDVYFEDPETHRKIKL
jgi:hypothetical protein